MLRLFILSLFFGSLTLSPADAKSLECSMEIDFKAAETAQKWRSVNDGVMGGLSSGGADFSLGHMKFSGVINTKGGGFSSIRANMQPGALSDTQGLKLRIKSDGRGYNVTFRTNAKYGWRRISFQTPIKTQSSGDWETIEVSYDNLKASIFGRTIRGATFDKSEVVEIGIILADGKDGPFSLEIDTIKAC